MATAVSLDDAMSGVTAPILLTSLRFAQGLAIGGQWGGAMLLVTESAPSDQRGYYGAFAQAGAPIGVILANLALIITSALVSEEFFNTWGWRIPFLASAVLILISMYIQLNGHIRVRTRKGYLSYSHLI